MKMIDERAKEYANVGATLFMDSPEGEYYNQPTQRAMEMGLFEVKKTAINKSDGSVLVSCTTKVTGKGQVYFINKFLG